MFDEFDSTFIDTGDASIFTRDHRGGGPAVLLLHGHPRTSATCIGSRRSWSTTGTRWFVPIFAATDAPVDRRPLTIILPMKRASPRIWSGTCKPLADSLCEAFLLANTHGSA